MWFSQRPLAAPVGVQTAGAAFLFAKLNLVCIRFLMDSNYTHEEWVEEHRLCEMHVNRIDDELRGVRSLIKQAENRLYECRNEIREHQQFLLELVNQRSAYIRRKERLVRGNG